MLKVRVIPTMLWKDHGLVKGVGFDSWRRVGTVMPSIKVYNTREVDELILVDISATGEQREPDYEAISEMSAECFVPFTIGGGIREQAHIRKLLQAGADKVSVNSAAYRDAGLVASAASMFGSQCVVASIDYRRKADGTYVCMSESGKREEPVDPVQWASELERMGAGEILLTSVNRDGTMQGYDLELTARVSAKVSIPVIASGGAGNYSHMVAAVKEGGASAVAAASIFHFTEQTPVDAKKHLAAAGIPARIRLNP